MLTYTAARELLTTTSTWPLGHAVTKEGYLQRVAALLECMGVPEKTTERLFFEFLTEDGKSFNKDVVKVEFDKKWAGDVSDAAFEMLDECPL